MANRTCSSQWLSIATASTSSIAVERAALLPPDTPLDLPHDVTHLSVRAVANLKAVSRSLGVAFPGIAKPQLYRCFQECEHSGTRATTTASHSDPSNVPKSTYPPSPDKPSSSKYLLCDDLSRRRTDNHSLCANSPDDRVRDSHQEDLLRNGGRSCISPANPSSKNAAHGPLEEMMCGTDAALTGAEVKSAQALSQWACSSPHAKPPNDALSLVLASQNPSAVVRAIFDESLTVDAMSALLAVIAEVCGSRVAAAMSELVVLPHVSKLMSPAPRDLMKAIVTLAESHWRAVISLYNLVGRLDSQVSITSPAAEVLIRCATVLPPHAAKDAILLCSGGIWNEESVPIVESLLIVCSLESGIASPLVEAFERSVGHLEKSVRFGKLLFKFVKDVPEARMLHAARIRNVAAKSKVYLSRRAVTLLEKSAKDA